MSWFELIIIIIIVIVIVIIILNRVIPSISIWRSYIQLWSN